MHLKCDTLNDSYEKVMYSIIWNHSIVVTEDKENTWQHTPMFIEINNPASDQFIHKNSPYGAQFYEAYANAIVNGYKPDQVFEYDYHSRLFAYESTMMNEGTALQSNQITYCICKLNESRVSRRAIAITWDPAVDTHRKDVPCLQNVQFWIEHDKLNMSVMFRSEDMLMGYPQNVYGLVSLMKYVAQQLGVKMGNYYHYVTIPHLYNIRDNNYLKVWV